MRFFTITEPDKGESSPDDKDDDSDLYRDVAEQPQPLNLSAAPHKTASFQPISPLFSPAAVSTSPQIDLLAEAFHECDVDGKDELRSDQIATFVDLLESKMQALSDDEEDYAVMADSAKQLLLATMQMYCSENDFIVDLAKLRELYESAMQRYMSTSFRYALFREFHALIVYPLGMHMYYWPSKCMVLGLFLHASSISNGQSWPHHRHAIKPKISPHPAPHMDPRQPSLTSQDREARRNPTRAQRGLHAGRGRVSVHRQRPARARNEILTAPRQREH